MRRHKERNNICGGMRRGNSSRVFKRWKKFLRARETLEWRCEGDEKANIQNGCDAEIAKKTWKKFS